MSETDTVEINEAELTQFVLFYAKESDEWEYYIPEGVEFDHVWDGIRPEHVDSVDSLGDGVEIQGSFTVPEIVDKIPAGPNRGYGPINPPEYITEDREVLFVVRFFFEDLGMVEASVEVV